MTLKRLCRLEDTWTRKASDLVWPSRRFLTVLWSISINTYIKHGKVVHIFMAHKNTAFRSIMFWYCLTPMRSFIMACSIWLQLQTAITGLVLKCISNETKLSRITVQV